MKRHDGTNCDKYYELKNIITLAAYENMLHCIGYRDIKVKRGKFCEWRNRFCVSLSSSDKIWEELTNLNLATYWETTQNRIYNLNDNAFEFIARNENVIIIREEGPEE